MDCWGSSRVYVFASNKDDSVMFKRKLQRRRPKPATLVLLPHRRSSTLHISFGIRGSHSAHMTYELLYVALVARRQVAEVLTEDGGDGRATFKCMLSARPTTTSDERHRQSFPTACEAQMPRGKAWECLTPVSPWLVDRPSCETLLQCLVRRTCCA